MKQWNIDMETGEKEPIIVEGLRLISVVRVEVEICRVDKEVPEDQYQQFKEWVLAKGIELGLGKHFEHYSYTDNYKDDIPICLWTRIL